MSFRQLPRRQENTLIPEVGFAGLKNFPGCVRFSKELDGGYGGEKVVGFSPLAKKIGVSPTLANSRHPMILIIISLASGTFLPLLPLYFLSVYSFLEIYTRMAGWSECAYCSKMSIGYRAFAHLVGMCARQMNTMLCYCCKGKEQQRNIISSRNCSNCSTELAK